MIEFGWTKNSAEQSGREIGVSFYIDAKRLIVICLGRYGNSDTLRVRDTADEPLRPHRFPLSAHHNLGRVRAHRSQCDSGALSSDREFPFPTLTSALYEARLFIEGDDMRPYVECGEACVSGTQSSEGGFHFSKQWRLSQVTCL